MSGASEYQDGAVRSRGGHMLKNFNFEVSWNNSWVSLNDHLRYTMSAEGFGVQQVTRRRMTVTSPFFDGEYETHSVRENVKEEVQIYVTSPSQSQLVEEILLLEDIFTQSVYNARKTLDEAREVWICQSADYTIDRSHIQAHNCRAVFTAQIPRLPAVKHEAVF